jgi:hypothetical protein
MKEAITVYVVQFTFYIVYLLVHNVWKKQLHYMFSNCTLRKTPTIVGRLHSGNLKPILRTISKHALFFLCPCTCPLQCVAILTCHCALPNLQTDKTKLEQNNFLTYCLPHLKWLAQSANPSRWGIHSCNTIKSSVIDILPLHLQEPCLLIHKSQTPFTVLQLEIWSILIRPVAFFQSIIHSCPLTARYSISLTGRSVRHTS